MGCEHLDKKTKTILILAKYTGYIAVLWIAVSNQGTGMDGPLLPFLLVFAVDNIRNFYLEGKAAHLALPSLYLQTAFAFLFIFMNGSVVGGILLVILIAESLVSYPRPAGDYIFFISIIGFFCVNLAGLTLRGVLSTETLAMVLINSLFLFFAYGVSYLARRQIEEKERAENTLRELNRSRKELEAAHRELLESSKQREQLAIIEERNRLAREIHDTLAHTLTTVVVGLEAGKKLLGKDPARALSELEKSQDQARKGLEEVRRSVRELRPRELDELGFDAALKGLAREFSESGVRVELKLEQEFEVSPALELPLYRIIQESVTNSLRHGASARVVVRLKQDYSGLTLEIEDDGKGCTKLKEGFGLQGIRERAAGFGGRVEFMNRSPHGFLVRIKKEGHGCERTD